ncbi:MAG: ShlB/FhaC/HecB family hemolysin secretion/activation protein [Janthinobacterium lividum]
MTIPTAVAGQVVPDRVDPALVTRSLPPAVTDDDLARQRVTQQPPGPSAPRIALAMGDVVARTIGVRGSAAVPADAFTAATGPYLGRHLSQDDLRLLAGAVAGIARDRGLVLATASIEPQDLAGGALFVTLDEGRVDAVRSIGRSSPAADRILATLVTHRAMTKHELERALLLVGDLPGVRVKDTRYVRQDGFGILLVTLDDIKVSTYVQFDNRGTREIGPIRGVGLVSVRGALIPNDEIGLVAAVTPIDPNEFAFVSGRYAAPIGSGGGAASISAFYGRTHAGGSFSDLALNGESYGFGIGYSAVLERTRTHSLWFDVDLHALATEQSALGYRFRDDHLTVLSGTLRSASTVAGGLLHVSAQVNAGLPVPGATHEGDPLASRPDGDARYVAGVFQADWTRTIAGPFSIALASVAQIASRPLLATAEISLGGPGFGRAYDYSERTGDQGVLGSAEVRIDLARLLAPTAQRVQLYAFGDGGTVTNLRDGYGGGTLASGGVGLRVGQGPVDGGIEVAIPITADRLDTGNRAARVSGQLAIHF